MPGTGFEDDYADPGTYSTLGFVDYYPVPNGPMYAVWTPGERFRDLDGDEQYDALLEPTWDGWGKTRDEDDGSGGTIKVADCRSPDEIPAGEEGPQDEIIDATEHHSIDEDGVWDFPEPFEDFLIIYNPEATTPETRWIKLDPSYKNEDASSRAWAEAYIRANYPGFVGVPIRGNTAADYNRASGFMQRFGNSRYDGPDSWAEVGNTKLQQAPASSMWVPNRITRKPDDGIWPWSYEDWWEGYYVERAARAGLTDLEYIPKAPEWNPRIPQMLEFDPADPALGFETPAARAFNPNCGGDKARTRFCPLSRDQLYMTESWDPATGDWAGGTAPNADAYAAEWGDPCQPLDPDTEDPWCDAPWEDDDAELYPTYPYYVNYGDGTVTGSPAGTIHPDAHGFYDGPAEFDDMPSSQYHARDLTGLLDLGPSYGNGGDGRLGEVTSNRNYSIYGHDHGSESPGGGGRL